MDDILASMTGSRKPLRIHVSTMDADLSSITVEPSCTGRQLFDTTCRIIGLRETWFFGLRYTNKRGLSSWLLLDRRLSQQEVKKEPDGSYHFLLVVKFYPESVEDELIQENTRHLFYLQTRQAIISGDLYCPPEAALLLASYVVQAAYGDCPQASGSSSFSPASSLDSAANTHHSSAAGRAADHLPQLDLQKLLPQKVMEQYDMTPEMWRERIRKWWANNQGLAEEEAEMEYLRVAQDLDMFGTQFYQIYNMKETQLLLGVTPMGIGVYEVNNPLVPRPFFAWAEIRNIQFSNRIFTIGVADRTKLQFRAQDCSINSSILDLCVGAHELFLRRRQADTLEVQQMKVQARERRQRRLVEKQRFQREREARLQAEMECSRYRYEVQLLSDQLASFQHMMLGGGGGSNGGEMMPSAGGVLQRPNISGDRVPSESALPMGRSNGSSAATMESQPSSHLNIRAHRFQQAPGVPTAVGNPTDPQQLPPEPTVGSYPHSASDQPLFTLGNSGGNGVGSGGGYFTTELQQLNAEMDRARRENCERERAVHEQLMQFRAEIENYKREELQTELDRAHSNNLNQGLDKYSTLRKSGAGSSRSRVKLFDNY